MEKKREQLDVALRDEQKDGAGICTFAETRLEVFLFMVRMNIASSCRQAPSRSTISCVLKARSGAG